jgi:glycogen synthase
MRNGMNKDFSWNASAKEYVRVYERVRQARTASSAALTAV